MDERHYAFETVDVFTDRRFGGNPLAVVTDARGLSDAQMQAIAREFNLSETTFVLPPRDPANRAQVRIFTPQVELAFAGHPNVGTALVLAEHDGRPERFVFEEAAGLVPIRFSWSGTPTATLEAPRPLRLGAEIPAETVAACVGLPPDMMVTARHRPLVAGCGTDFVLAEVTAAGLAAALPDPAAMRHAAAQWTVRPAGFPVHLYVQDGEAIRTRMFSPLSGIPEDPATGSANVALAALLLHLSGAGEGRWTITQGVEMGRPSLLQASAWRTEGGIRAAVGGSAVPVMHGVLVISIANPCEGVP